MNLQVGVGRGIQDTAQVIIGSQDLDVTILTPGRSPGVLHQPVLGTVLLTVTGKQNTVVKSLTAGAGKDTTRVVLESQLVSLDGDRHGLLGNSGLQSGDTTSLHVSVGLGGNVGVVGVAGSLATAGRASGTGSVGVLSLGGDTAVVLHKGEGIVHPATVATRVTTLGVARHKLLLGEGLKIIVLDVVSTLQSTGGGERPARTAVALVLHGGNSTRGDPVDGSGVSRNISRGGVLGGIGIAAKVGDSGTADLDLVDPLIVGKVGESVKTHLEGLGAIGIVLLNEVEVVGEHAQSLDEISTIL